MERDRIYNSIPLNFSIKGDIHKLGLFLKSFRKHLTPGRLRNLLLAEAEYLLRAQHVRSRPYFLKIDPTNRCNLRCPLCPTRVGPYQIKSEKKMVYSSLPFDLYRKIIDEVGAYLFRVLLYGLGEPFLARDIFRMIRYASERNIGVAISTNLTVLRESEVDEVVTSGLEHIQISIDGTDPDTYGRYRVGGDFNKAFDSMSKIIEAKKRLKSKTPFVEWQFLVMKHNEHQVSEAERMAREIGTDYISFFPISNINPARKDLLEKWVAVDPRYNQYDVEKGVDIRKKKPAMRCSWLYRAAMINSDGTLSPCCYFPDYEGSCFGDLRTQSFRDIWNGRAYVSARALFGRGAPVKDEAAAGICAACRSAKEGG